MSQFRLANILFQLPEHLRCYPEMIYRAQGAVDFDEESRSFAFEGELDLLTYFNGFSAAKWRKYAAIEDVRLHLELVGDPCEISFTGIEEGSVTKADAPDPAESHTSSTVKVEALPRSVGCSHVFAGSSDYMEIDLEVPAEGMLLVGAILATTGATAVRNAYWYTQVPEERIREVRIAVATTTFKNEGYILPNIKTMREDVLGSGQPVAEALHLFVVDNGQTLDAEGLSHDGVTVLPNANEGGSAGFARGMMAALEADERFTHVLLMDDDVRIAPESIIRTFNLLSLVTDEYADAFINGAMLEMQHPNKQFEDVSHVRADGIYQRLKGDLFMDSLVDVAVNEVVDVEVQNAYGAWWYSCIPLSAVRAHGLPLPIFVRCDDVEYGMRCKPTYMTMNGICVWHMAFGEKFRAAVDSYQYLRNYMIMNAIHGISSETMFMARANRTLRMYLRAMAYETADLFVSGFEDYLKGPEWLMGASGEKLFKEGNARAEKLIPLADALSDASAEHPELAASFAAFQPDEDAVRDNQRAGLLLRLWRTAPYDRHLLPDALLRSAPATAYYGGYTIFSPAQIGTKVLVACDRAGEMAHVRFMDRALWKAIRKRWAAVKADYRLRGADVAQAYRDALPEMSSVEYWREHLRSGDQV